MGFFFYILPIATFIPIALKESFLPLFSLKI